MRVYQRNKKVLIIDHCIECPRLKRCAVWSDPAHRVRVASGPVPFACELPRATDQQERTGR